jgi:hypothetical protein
VPEIFVSDHSFMLCSGDGSGLDPENAQPSRTGTETGSVQLEIAVVNEAPDPERLADGWEEIAEVSLTTNDGLFGVVLMVAVEDGPITVHVGQPGPYRLRLHVKGRDIASAHITVTKALETHLLTFWPAPTAPPRLLKSTDDFGALFGRSPVQ